MSRPLDDLVVLDLSRLFCTSLCAAFLADFGARVIRLEPAAAPARAATGWNHEADLIHRNKQSLALDLGSEQGRTLLHQLLAKTDAFVTDCSVAELAALGIDYEGACKLRADIVYGRLSGFGPVGPDKDLPAIDELAAARTGMMPILPQPGQPPVYTGAGAMHAGTMLAFGVVTALFHRAVSGEGQAVDVSLFGANMYGAALDIQAFLAIGKGDRLLNPISRLDVSNPMSGSLYKASDGRWVTLTMPDTDRWWPTFSKVTGLNQADPRFDTHDKRTESHRLDLIHALEAAFAQHDGAHWRRIFVEHELSADIIERFDHPAGDPQTLANRYVIELDHPSLGRVKSLGFPIYLSEGTARLDRLAPCVGQHGGAVLRDLLGCSEDQVQAWRSAGVLG